MEQLDKIISDCFKRAENRCEMVKRLGLWARERCTNTKSLKPYYLSKSNITKDKIKILCHTHYNEMMDSKVKIRTKKPVVNEDQGDMFGGL